MPRSSTQFRRTSAVGRRSSEVHGVVQGSSRFQRSAPSCLGSPHGSHVSARPFSKTLVHMGSAPAENTMQVEIQEEGLTHMHSLSVTALSLQIGAGGVERVTPNLHSGNVQQGGNDNPMNAGMRMYLGRNSSMLRHAHTATTDSSMGIVPGTHHSYAMAGSSRLHMPGDEDNTMGTSMSGFMTVLGREAFISHRQQGDGACTAAGISQHMHGDGSLEPAMGLNTQVSTLGFSTDASLLGTCLGAAEMVGARATAAHSFTAVTSTAAAATVAAAITCTHPAMPLRSMALTSGNGLTSVGSVGSGAGTSVLRTVLQRQAQRGTSVEMVSGTGACPLGVHNTHRQVSCRQLSGVVTELGSLPAVWMSRNQSFSL